MHARSEEYVTTPHFMNYYLFRIADNFLQLSFSMMTQCYLVFTTRLPLFLRSQSFYFC